MAKAPRFRDRIKGFRKVRASDIIVNPENWRDHPTEQQAELQRIMAEVGNCGVLTVVGRPDGTLLLVDGQLRRGLHGDSEVYVAELDLDDDETRKVLASFDRIGGMAQTDEQKLSALMAAVAAADAAPPRQADDRAVSDLVDRITTEEPVTVHDERQAVDMAQRASHHLQRLAQTAPELMEQAQCVIVPTDGACELLVIADPDLDDIVRELRQRHEDGETHPLDRLFDCIWTPANA